MLETIRRIVRAFASIEHVRNKIDNCSSNDSKVFYWVREGEDDRDATVGVARRRYLNTPGRVRREEPELSLQGQRPSIGRCLLCLVYMCTSNKV